MKCPFCGHADTQVADSRVSVEGASVRRRRRCMMCDKRFTTFETADIRLPQVIKAGGYRVDFAVEKVRTSLLRALHKRPVSTEQVEEVIVRICHKLLQLGDAEVSSRQIGEMVMTELARLDKVAYVRFASVYRSFQHISEFADTIKEIQKTGRE